MTNWYSVADRAVNAHGALHHADELAMLLRLLAEHEPVTIVETGTWAGGSAWAFAQLPTVDLIVSVDQAPQPRAYDTVKELGGKLHLIEADSTQYDTVQLVTEALAGYKADVVFIDGGHDLRTARLDWRNYHELAKPDGLVVIHDTQGYPGLAEFQVPMLWAEIRAQHRTLELVAVPGGPGGTGIVWL